LRAYEVMLILPADADEKVVGTAVDRITKAIEPSGGSVVGIDRWGRRRFAFELNRQTEGYYAVVAFDAEPPTIAPLERALTLADEVVRAKVTIRHPQKAQKAETGAGEHKQTRSAPAPEPEASAPEPEAETTSPPEAEKTAEQTAETEPSPAPA